MPRPSLEEIGLRGAYYFTRRRTWLRRHVQTFHMRTDETGVTRVTIDAEDGTTLPMPNRIDNARITAEALRGSSLERLRLNDADREPLDRYLEALVYETDPDAQAAWLAHAFALADEADHERFVDADGLRMRQLWRDVATDSIVWVTIVGAPGQRRVVKFNHDVALIRPTLWPHREREVAKCYEIEGKQEPYNVWDPGDYNSRGFVRRLWHRVASTIGWAAYDVTVYLPWVRHTQSYHFQFEAPNGLEVRNARLRCRLVDRNGEVVRPTRELSREGAHIYFADAIVRRAGPVEVTIRVGRRGFLSLAVATGVVIAAMLWGFAHFAASLSVHPEVPAVVALVVPPLLAIFAVRPEEHTVAVRMLSGVRAALIIDGLLSAAAALAFAGACPFGWKGPGTACHYHAVAASAVAAVLIVSWLLALDVTEALRSASRSLLRSYLAFRWAGISLVALAAGLIWSFSNRAGLHSAEHWLRLATLVALAGGALWISTYWSADDEDIDRLRHRQLAGVMLSLVALPLGAAAPVSAGYDLGVIAWADVRTPLLVSVLGALVLLVLLEPMRRLEFPPPLVENSGNLIFDWQEAETSDEDPTRAARRSPGP